MRRRKLPLIMAITLLLVISGSVLWWTSSAHFTTNNDVVIVRESSTPLNHRDKPNYSDITGFIANSVIVQESSTPLNHRDKSTPLNHRDKSTPLNHRDKSNYSGNTMIEATTLAQHSGVTELTVLTGSEPHVTSKQSLPTLPSIPADMPYPEDIKSREELQKTECVSKLYDFILNLDKSVSPHVNMVFGDSEHTNLVLNWIIAALLRLEPPLHNVVVISLDRPLCDTLTAKKLPLTCIVVSIECIFGSNVYDGGERGWLKRMMVRHPVLRLINYWGYDVASYDSDAVLLRNPQPLYEERPHMSVLASSSFYPKVLASEWGFVACAGALMLRSSPSTETMWSHVHSVTMSKKGEQTSLNYALKDMGVKWIKTTDLKRRCSEKIGWESEGPLKVFVFPEEKFCRYCCRRSSKETYNVHYNSGSHLGMTTKEGALKNMNAWFMKSNWRDFNNPAITGVEWLRRVSTL